MSIQNLLSYYKSDDDLFLLFPETIESQHTWNSIMWKHGIEMASIPSPLLVHFSGWDKPKERRERFALSEKININIRKQKARLLLALMLRLAADTETVKRDRCRANGQADISSVV